ncbi:MAG: hypothetical protein NC310_03980 [Roseburia sp.]|nr:hypothetical protein [Anaeroplasma bactoclasticum]MCM1196219.1 hypothetical protein [Roseburia sp.]MCM1556014.1 hypothetical protein [Anaeroplasma bactoclasticum]
MRKVDLIFFTILAIAAELITSISFAKLNSGFYFSFAMLIYIIYSLRWGKIAIVSLILSGIPLVFVQPIGQIASLDIWKGILYYMLSNVFAVLPIAVYGNRNRNKIIESPFLLFLYVLLVFICVSIGKEIALLIINNDPLGGVKYFVSQIFTLILSILILYILCRLKTKLVCDMNEYIKEEQEQEDYVEKILEKGESESDERNKDENGENQEHFA